MEFLKGIFGSRVIDKEKLTRSCYSLKLLAAQLSDLTPYQCQMNHGLLNDAVVDDKGHRFCRGCIDSYMLQSNYCPANPEDNHKIKQLTKDKQTDMMVGSLNCLCLNSRDPNNPCSYKFNVQDYAAYAKHKQTCPKQIIKCLNQNCQVYLWRQDIPQHMNIQCKFTQWSCPYCRVMTIRGEQQAHQRDCQDWPQNCINSKCHMQLTRKTLQQHLAYFCQQQTDNCPKRRCKEQFLRKQNQNHKLHCQYADCKCIYCGKTYEKFDQFLHEGQCLQIPLKCQNNGCSQSIPRKNWKHHCHDTCQQKIMRCPSDGCTHSTIRRDLPQHLLQCVFFKIKCEYCAANLQRRQLKSHQNVCQMYPVICGNGQCRKEIQRKDRDWHIRVECGWTSIGCRFACNGCKEATQRHLMPKHQQLCLYRLEPCSLCKKPMPFITIQNHIVKQCSHKQVPCPQNCKQCIMRKDLGRHIQETCQETIVSCPYSHYGCSLKVLRRQTESHRMSALGQHHLLVLQLSVNLSQKVDQVLVTQELLDSKMTLLHRQNQQAQRQLKGIQEEQLRQKHILKQAQQAIEKNLAQTGLNSRVLQAHGSSLKTINSSIVQNKNAVAEAYEKIKGISQRQATMQTSIDNIASRSNQIWQETHRLDKHVKDLNSMLKK